MPKCLWLLGNFQKIPFKVKTSAVTFLANFKKMGYFFIPLSVHTDLYQTVSRFGTSWRWIWFYFWSKSPLIAKIFLSRTRMRIYCAALFHQFPKLVTRLGDFLRFGRLFKAYGNIFLPKLATFSRDLWKSYIFLVKLFLGTFYSSIFGHPASDQRKEFRTDSKTRQKPVSFPTHKVMTTLLQYLPSIC